MPNILVRGHMRFDDSEDKNTMDDVVNKMMNLDEHANKTPLELNEEMIHYLTVLKNRINELDNLIKVDESKLKERINDDSRLIMKEIFCRYGSLLKHMNLSFDDLSDIKNSS